MTIDKPALKALAEATKGWDHLTKCWKAGPDWQVGRIDEDDNRWPVMTIDTAEYDCAADAVKLARYYAAANPAAILELLSEIDRLEKMRKLDQELNLERELIAERDQLFGETEQLKAESEALKAAKLYWVAPPGIGIVRCVADERYRKFSPSIRARYQPVQMVPDEGLRLRCERLEADKKAMAETHTLYTWLRKKCDQPSNDAVSVHMNIGHDWVAVHDLDKDLRAMIDAEEP